MLRRLKVENLAVVESVEVEFDDGLNVITGETGAGKSVLMGAIELALGGKADASVVREGAKEAEVEAEFDGTVIRRVVGANGRSRAWVNDSAVGVSELRELGASLVDIHGPRSNQNILEESFQRSVLDSFGGVAHDEYDAKWGELVAIRGKIAALEGMGATEDELDLLRFQVAELEEAGICADDEDLAERHAAQAHAEEIVTSANEITEILGGDQGVSELLISLGPRFNAIAKHMPAASDWATEAEELTVRVQELSRSVADAVSRLEVDPAEFAEMDSRLGVVNRLLRKYRVSGVSGLIALLEEKKAKLVDLENRDVTLEELRAEEVAAVGSVRKVGATLTRARTAAAKKLSVAVRKGLRDLGFLKAEFSVALEACEPESHGCDRVIYMFEPNPGECARPLADIASSGETARVMLALKGVLAEHDVTGTLIFDEIDANIGGEVGHAVGAKLKAVSSHHQVIAITHLPQSAVWGERHIVVSKTVSGGRTRTSAQSVSGESRVDEITRMLGGGDSPVVRKHAEELLRDNR